MMSRKPMNRQNSHKTPLSRFGLPTALLFSFACPAAMAQTPAHATPTSPLNVSRVSHVSRDSSGTFGLRADTAVKPQGAAKKPPRGTPLGDEEEAPSIA